MSQARALVSYRDGFVGTNTAAMHPTEGPSRRRARNMFPLSLGRAVTLGFVCGGRKIFIDIYYFMNLFARSRTSSFSVPHIERVSH